MTATIDSKEVLGVVVVDIPKSFILTNVGD